MEQPPTRHRRYDRSIGSWQGFAYRPSLVQVSSFQDEFVTCNEHFRDAERNSISLKSIADQLRLHLSFVFLASRFRANRKAKVDPYGC